MFLFTSRYTNHAILFQHEANTQVKFDITRFIHCKSIEMFTCSYTLLKYNVLFILL